MSFIKASCTWLVQATTRGETRERLERACAENGNPLHFVPVIPFSEQLPAEMSAVEGPFVFYGYTTLLLAAFRDPYWRRGVFFDPDVFRPSVYRAQWGAERMLNGDARIQTMREFAEATDIPLTSSWFVKPDDDLKRFTGGVMTHAEFRDWYAHIAALEEGDVGPDTRILVGEPKTFGHEWRLFLVDSKPVAASCYSNDGRDLPLPPELEQFAIEAARDWSPAPAFALDVTIDEEGKPRLIEANCINGSGFYNASLLTIVRALSHWQEAVWE